MVIRGLHPERTARLEALVDECRPLLTTAGGMAVVQRLLSERRVEVLDAVVITRELLRAGPTALGEAKTIVLASPGRGHELRVHEQFVDDLEQSAVSTGDDPFHYGYLGVPSGPHSGWRPGCGSTGSAGLCGLFSSGACAGEAVGVGAGLDDRVVEGEAVDDGRVEAGICEGLGPAAEGLVGGDGDAVLLLAFGQYLEEEFGAAAVESM